MAETDERPKPEATKEPYSTPQLVRYGTVEELTQGGPPSGALADLASVTP